MKVMFPCDACGALFFEDRYAEIVACPRCNETVNILSDGIPDSDEYADEDE